MANAIAPQPTDATSKRFVHLHLHTEYSLLDGGNRVDKLVDRVKELGMDSVAVTDHGNMHAAVEFYTKAKKAGIKPILGIEAYVAPGDRTDRTFTGVQDGGHHLVMLAETQQGWLNLLKLSSDAFINGFYFKPRMDKATLEQWNEGIIVINGHLGSSVAAHLMRYVQTHEKAHFDHAVDEALWHKETFGPNANGDPRFYLELQRHDTDEQEQINPYIIEIARKIDVPLVCDNDAHYLTRDDWDAHDSLCCISMGKVKQESNRLRYSRELYVKSHDEMRELFGGYIKAEGADTSAGDEAMANTIAIADRCNVELDFDSNYAPVVKIQLSDAIEKLKGATPFDQALAYECEHEVGSTEWYKSFCSQIELLPFDEERDSDITSDELKEQCDIALRLLSEAGAIWRYGPDGVDDDKRARLDRELKILADKLISAYFLIVWDFVNEARRRGIPSNARGSGVGTMVGYVLGLSNACPVEYGLLFERFTDPDRSEYPDIDIDICQDGRQEIIEYVRNKYGFVAQIITFGTLKARAAVRDVGRVLDVPLPEVDKACKLIGDGLKTTIDSAMEAEAELRDLHRDNPMWRDMLDTARRLEGMARHAGVHAAGVIVATQPLENIVPLYKANQGEDIPTVTQWDGPTCEKVGLLKMDFLGLRTLSTVELAKKLIRASFSEQTIRQSIDPEGNQPESWNPLDLDRLHYDDPKVLSLFARGETAGVFQFESGGMRNTLMAIKPDRLEDLIAANALYRPGPMDLIDDYCDRKHGRSRVPQVHPIVDKFTAETYGIMVYQEQVMQILHELGGIALREAYSIIKAISKKKEDVINAARGTFVDGAKERGLDPKKSNELFDLILKFAGYGFNKSHSTGYAILAYQTAYLKTYFPVQYMSAVLTYESVSTDKVVEYMEECRKVLRPDGQRGIEVRPPAVNTSMVGFTPVFDEGETRDASHGHIRFGLGAVKGVGEKAINAVIESRDSEGDFNSLYDFCERVPSKSVNRATIEALIKCGAFDDVHGIDSRAAMVESLDSAISAGQAIAADRSAGQMNFFESFDESEADARGAATAVEASLAGATPWSTKERLDHEKSVLGLYVSSHPLNEHIDTMARYATVEVADIEKLAANTEVVIAGMLTRVRPTFVKNGRSAGQKMAMITIEDKTASIDGVVFSDTYAITSPLLESDRIVFLRGKIDRKREEPSIVVNGVVPVEQAAEQLTQAVHIVLRERESRGMPPYNGELESLRQLLRNARRQGDGPMAEVYFEVREGGQVIRLRADGMRVSVTHELVDRINAVMHEDNACRLVGGTKLMQRRDRDALMHDDATEQDRLRRSSRMEDEDFCDSIDRY